MIGSLIKEIKIGKRDLASELVKKFQNQKILICKLN